MSKFLLAGFAALAVATSSSPSHSQVAAAAPIEPLAALDITRYLGTWYQVALYPNRFQAQCASDTTATYRERTDGNIEVINRCRDAAGKPDEAMGLTRPLGKLAGGELRPAHLEVSFLPAWLRWAQAIGNWGWGDYRVIQLAMDYRYAVVSDGSRQYLWILSRSPALAADDEAAIRSRLLTQGFDLARLQMHPQGKAGPPTP